MHLGLVRRVAPMDKFFNSPVRRIAVRSALIPESDTNHAYDARTDRSFFTTSVRRSTA